MFVLKAGVREIALHSEQEAFRDFSAARLGEDKLQILCESLMAYETENQTTYQRKENNN